jgi:hypothetical protein
MATPFDLLSQQLDTPTDPDDQLRLMLGQDQGASLPGGPSPTPDGMPDTGQQAPPGAAGMPQPMAPSPNVPGPLSALARKAVPVKGKPHIRLVTKKKKIKPHIKLKASAYG